MIIKSRTGISYDEDIHGTRRRIEQKPWHGKSERRKVLKMRRALRENQTAN